MSTQENEMASFASKLINALFTKASARPAAVRRRRAALGFEPLELRAVLSTVVPIGQPLPEPLPEGEVIAITKDPAAGVCYGVSALAWARVDGAPVSGSSTRAAVNGGSSVADDVVVDGRIITGENFQSAELNGNLQLTELAGVAIDPAGAHGSGGGVGAGKVSMHDISLSLSSLAIDPAGPRSDDTAGDGRDVLLGGLRADHLLASDSTSGHIGGVNVLFSDGSVRFISDTIAVRLADAPGNSDFITYTGLE
jgi:prepilin-type processing-associated H-X9-DG protein